MRNGERHKRFCGSQNVNRFRREVRRWVRQRDGPDGKGWEKWSTERVEILRRVGRLEGPPEGTWWKGVRRRVRLGFRGRRGKSIIRDERDNKLVTGNQPDGEINPMPKDLLFLSRSE